MQSECTEAMMLRGDRKRHRTRTWKKDLRLSIDNTGVEFVGKIGYPDDNANAVMMTEINRKEESRLQNQDVCCCQLRGR